MPFFKKISLTGEKFKKLTGREPRPENAHQYPHFGKYTLVHRIECQPPDDCYHAWPPGRSGSVSPNFLRTFPRELFTEPMIQWLRRYVEIHEKGIERIFELDVVADRGMIASEYIFGASVADIARALASSERKLSWPLALALFGASLKRLLRLHARGIGHGGVSARLIRLTADGEVWLCRGLPHSLNEIVQSPPGQSMSLPPEIRDQDLVALGRAILPLGAGNRGSQAAELFAGRDRQGFAVLSDLIVEYHPEIADVVVDMLWPASDPKRALSPDYAERLMHRALREVDHEEKRQLLEIAVSSSPDYCDEHHHMGR